MLQFQRLLAHPISARWFAQALAIFWPALYRQTSRIFR